jgi:hypothetical protein
LVQILGELKKIVAIGLLFLLLYNSLGLTIAILFFDNQYKTATDATSSEESRTVKMYLPSLPYSNNWENSDGIEGLVQENGKFYNATNLNHTNDTLYVTLTSNSMARDHFVELSSMMEQLTNQDSELPQNSKEKALTLLSGLFKLYIEASGRYFVPGNFQEGGKIRAVYNASGSHYLSYLAKLQTPPPERI